MLPEIGVVWGLGAPKVIGKLTIRYSAYDFLFNFNRSYASILYRFKVIASYLMNVDDYNLPHLHLSPQHGVTPFKFHRYLWYQKTRVPVLSCGGVCVIVSLAVLIE